MLLKQCNEIPAGLLTLRADELHQVLDGPTPIHLPGRRQPAMFVSVLLHGNEHTSWDALRTILTKYQNQELPRAMSIFIGNVPAAQQNMRFLDGQLDFNRIWGGTTEKPQPLMQQVITEMRERGVFLSIDVHNNTGKNPHYACINRIDDRFLYLAHLFSRTIVYFVKPEGVQSMAFAQFCPAVTVECGLSGDRAGTQHVTEFIDACLHLAEFPERPFNRQEVNVFHTIAICKVSEQASVGFGEEGVDLNFDAEIEYWNFRELEKNSVIAQTPHVDELPLRVESEQGGNVSHVFFDLVDNQVKTKMNCIPAMITRDINAIRKDCFCYLMERYPLE